MHTDVRVSRCERMMSQGEDDGEGKARHRGKGFVPFLSPIYYLFFLPPVVECISVPSVADLLFTLFLLPVALSFSFKI